MSFAEIEAELPLLTPDELHRLALKSWTVFVEKQSRRPAGNDCSEDDPQLLAALDEAIEKAGVAPNQGFSANEVRARLSKWTSK
jgi:hypothetical protein